MFKLRKTVGIFARLRQQRETISTGLKDRFDRLEKRVEGTFAEKWLKFWKNVGRDYRDVAMDLLKETREKPSKAIIIATSSWLTVSFALTNPNATHFRDAFVQSSNDAAIVHHSLVKPEVLQHLKLIEHSYNNNLVRHTSFGLFSIIWLDKNSSQCAGYDSQCNYLQLSYLDIWHRIIDVGFLDTWWCLLKKMKDYDINY